MLTTTRIHAQSMLYRRASMPGFSIFSIRLGLSVCFTPGPQWVLLAFVENETLINSFRSVIHTFGRRASEIGSCDSHFIIRITFILVAKYHTISSQQKTAVSKYNKGRTGEGTDSVQLNMYHIHWRRVETREWMKNENMTKKKTSTEYFQWANERCVNCSACSFSACGRWIHCFGRWLNLCCECTISISENTHETQPNAHETQPHTNQDRLKWR